MSKQSKMTGADYLLLLLYLDNCSAINGAIRITKMMFLFNMEIAPVLKKKGVSIRDEDLPKFSAYNYGPFSKDVYEQVELFQSIGFIKVKNLYATEEMSEVDDWEESAFETEFSEGSCQYSSNQDGKFMQYKLLNLGKKYVESEIIPQLTNDQLAVLTTYKHIIFVGYSLPIADFEFRYMLQKNVTSSAKIDVILTPNSNPDLVANNLKDLLPSKRYLDAFPKNKVSFYYEGFGPYFSLSK